MVSAAQKGRLAGGTRTHDIRRLMQNRIAASAIRMTHDTSLYQLSYSQHKILKVGPGLDSNQRPRGYNPV